jgi:hypothetical protein
MGMPVRDHGSTGLSLELLDVAHNDVEDALLLSTR